jgi:hypothetical protein
MMNESYDLSERREKEEKLWENVVIRFHFFIGKGMK